MSSGSFAIPQGESSVGNSFVSARGIVLMSCYLVLLCTTLSYCLTALWPLSPPFAITSVKPNHGTAKGGTQVELVGTGFTEGSQVFFGDVSAKTLTRKSDSLLVVETPESIMGSVPVEIDAPNGQKTTLASGFNFEPEGQSKPVSPPNQPQSSQSITSIPAQNPSNLALPLFGWATAISSSVRLLLIVVVVGSLGSLIHVVRSFYWYVGNRNLKSSWMPMYFLLPFSGAGLALLFFLIMRGLSTGQPNIQSTTVDGYAAVAALVGMFSQQALAKLKQIAEGFFSTAEKGKDPAISVSTPKVANISPAEGPTSGGLPVAIVGTGLTGVTHVTFGGIPATNITVDSDTHVTATAPAHATGNVDVEIATASGQKSSISGIFNYADLTVDRVDPASGPVGGGTNISISGNGFGPGCSVKIGSAPATSVYVGGLRSITATTPAGAIGAADIEITNPDGKRATLPAGFQFT